jgi:hypothetical protein
LSTVKARFDGRVFVPQEPVDLPVGMELEIVLPRSVPNGTDNGSLAALTESLEKLPVNPDWPADGAAQHDHYLYGTPKRS